MTKFASFLFCLLLGGTLVVPNLPPSGSSALAFEPIHQSLVVKVKKDKKDDDDDDEKPKKEKKAKNCKKERCEPGMFVLDKPNIYGACCQATAAPLTPKTAPAETEKCQFPGEIGEPPNCKCPDGTEFMGYRGCLPKKADPVGPSPKKVVQRICCTGKYPNGDSAGRACGGEEAGLRKIMESSRKINDPSTAPSTITCAPEK